MGVTNEEGTTGPQGHHVKQGAVTGSISYLSELEIRLPLQESHALFRASFAFLPTLNSNSNDRSRAGC
jgi:hypothetical protein